VTNHSLPENERPKLFTAQDGARFSCRHYSFNDQALRAPPTAMAGESRWCTQSVWKIASRTC